MPSTYTSTGGLPPYSNAQLPPLYEDRRALSSGATPAPGDEKRTGPVTTAQSGTKSASHAALSFSHMSDDQTEFFHAIGLKSKQNSSTVPSTPSTEGSKNGSGCHKNNFAEAAAAYLSMR